MKIVRLYKVTPDSILPLSFRVPRKSDAFADDIFFDCSSDEPALNTDAWLGGSNANPKTMSLSSGYVEKPRQSSNPTFTKSETQTDNEPTGNELSKAYREQKQRIAYLESELTKANQKIKDLTK
jgi:coronin-1B/1C/6